MMRTNGIHPAAPSDVHAIAALLQAADLPVEGVADALDGFVVAVEDDRIVGAGGVEEYGEDGLLRSVVVDARARSTGLGSALTEAAIERARARGLDRLYLLTTTAEGFFPRFGFRAVSRDEAPAAIRRSPEFASLCPEGATVMLLSLAEDGS